MVQTSQKIIYNLRENSFFPRLTNQPWIHLTRRKPLLTVFTENHENKKKSVGFQEKNQYLKFGEKIKNRAVFSLSIGFRSIFLFGMKNGKPVSFLIYHSVFSVCYSFFIFIFFQFFNF
jgi:hypothetical protein